MRFDQPFLKLPIRFDADALAAEVRALPPSSWVAHPTGYPGNEAVRLVSPGGKETDATAGPMGPTVSLNRCDYVRQIMAEIGAVWGRSRFMGLAAGRQVPPHIDIRYYWRTHWRIHIPVITNPGVLFTCGDETVHMAAGECWVFDSFRCHDVQNNGSEQRIHLVLDTVGGGNFGDLLKAAALKTAEPRLLRPGERSAEGLAFEKVNSPKVMSPWEMRCHLNFIREAAGKAPGAAEVLGRVEEFVDDWAAAWARFGTDDGGREEYERLAAAIQADVESMGAREVVLPNKVRLSVMIEHLILVTALAKPDGPVARKRGPAAPSAAPEPLAAPFRDRFDRPIVIVSTPRSGSTLLYETLEQAPGLYSTGDESHRLIESIEGLAPRHRGWTSNRLTGEDATPARAEELAARFYRNVKDRDGRPPDGRIRMLEKTPKNALRVPFFNAIWPDAQFIYLYRDVRETLYSMMEAWHTGRFRTYPGLPGWRGPPWSMVLVPNWHELDGMQLPQIVAHQWAITTEVLLSDLEELDPSKVHAIDYASLLSSPQNEMKRLTGAVGLSWDRELGETLPLSKTTASRPNRDKWRRLEPVIRSILPIVERADERARAFLQQHRSPAAAAA
jgi:hypothetical protein